MNKFQKLISITVLLVTSNNQMVSLQNIAQSKNIINTTPNDIFFSWTTRRTGEAIRFGLDNINPKNKNLSVFNASLQDTETNLIDTWKHQSTFSFVPEGWLHKLSEMKKDLDPPLTQPSNKVQESINMQTSVTKRQREDGRSMGSVDELNKNSALRLSIPSSSYPVDIMMPVIPPHQKGEHVHAPYQPLNYIQPLRLDIRLLPPPTYRVELPQRPFLPFSVPTTNATKSNTSHSVYNMVTIGQTESDTTPTDIFFSWTTRRTVEDIPFGIDSISPKTKNLSVFNTALQDTETNIINTWKHHSVFNFVPELWFPKSSEMKQNLDPPRTQLSLQNIKEQENINMQNLVMKRQKGDWRFLDPMDEMLPETIPPSSLPMDIMVPVMPPRQKGDYVNAPQQPPDYIHPIRLDIRLLPPPMYREYQVELPQRPFQPLPPDIPPPYPYLLPFTALTTNATKSNTSHSVHNIVTIDQTESDTTPADILFSGTARRTKDGIAIGINRLSPQNNNFSVSNTTMQDTEINVIDTWKHPSVFSFVPAGWFPKLTEMKQYLDPPLTQPSLQNIKEQEDINVQNLLSKRQKGMMRLIPLKKGTIGKKIGTLKQLKGQSNFSSLLKTIGTKYT